MTDPYRAAGPVARAMILTVVRLRLWGVPSWVAITATATIFPAFLFQRSYDQVGDVLAKFESGENENVQH